jgi:hypothetical protein
MRSRWHRPCLLLSLLLLDGAATAGTPAPAGEPDPVTLIATRGFHGAFAHSGMRSDSAMDYRNFFAEILCESNAPGGGEALFLYPLELPPLAGFLESVRLWGYDLDGGDLRLRLLRACTSFSPPFATRTVLAERELAAQPGAGAVLIDLPVDLAPSASTDCSHLLEVRVARSGQACQGGLVSVMRLRLQMRDPEHIFRDGFFQQARLPSVGVGEGGRP